MISFIFPLYKQDHVLWESINLLQSFLSKNLGENFEIILCNDGSPDNGPKIAKELSDSFKTVRAIGYEKNRGRGYAIKYAGNIAKGEYIIYMDCDLVDERYLKYISEMVEKIKEFDIVIASRFLPESKSERKWQRKLISKVYRTIITITFSGFMVTDPDVGFKGFKKKCFRDVNISCNLNGHSWDLQFLVNAHREQFKIKELPFKYIEDYERTTVNIFTASFIEFLGLIYIKITYIISKYVNF